jgi:hypothetical protein
MQIVLRLTLACRIFQGWRPPDVTIDDIDCLAREPS